MEQQLIIFCLIVLLQLSPEGVLCDEDALLPSTRCLWSWSPWSQCDPGPCNKPRNERDRMRIILQAPLKKMNESCGFSIRQVDTSPQSPYDESSTDFVSVETESCTTGEPCYWSNSSCSTGSGMFRCYSRECIPSNLVSNGDRDCMDGSDEYAVGEKTHPCLKDLQDSLRPLPNSYVWSSGRDLLYNRLGKPVLSELYHGTCDVTTDALYRKQFNVEDVVPLVDNTEVQSVLSFTNWVPFAKHLQNILKFSQSFSDVYNALENLENVTFHEGVSVTLVSRLKLKKPKFLQVKPDFFQSLRNLPKVYSYEKYFEFFQTYGTHYFEEATLGGVVRIYFAFDSNKYAIKDIEESLYNFLGYLNGNTTLRGTYDLLRKAKIQRFVVTGGKTQFTDLNGLTLRRFNQKLYSDWLQSLQFYPEVIDVSMFNNSGDFDNQQSNTYLPLSRLLEGDHVVLDNKITIWENLEMALKDYQQPYSDEETLCIACPEPERAFIVPDVSNTVVTSQNQRQYGCICATKDGGLPVEVAAVKTESEWQRIARLVMIAIGCLLGVVVFFVILDWCLGWRIVRCECKEDKHSSPYDDMTEQESLSTNGKTPQNGRISSTLIEPDITLTEIDESGIERDMSAGRLVDYPYVEYK